MRDAIGSAGGLAVLTTMLLTGASIPAHAPAPQAALPLTAPQAARPATAAAIPAKPKPPAAAKAEVPKTPQAAANAAAPARNSAGPGRSQPVAVANDDKMKDRTRTVARQPGEPRAVSKSKAPPP
jgi:hypothetical protein